MKKYSIFIILSIIIIIIIVFFISKNIFNNNINNDKSNYSSSKTLANLSNDNILLDNSQNEANNISFLNQQISSYSTVIKDTSPGRLNNINITCSILNNLVIKSGQTFSFNDIVGEPTSERGYQEASVIIDGKTEQGIGGGNCQVSSTLYNAVLLVPDLTVLERHEHGKNVTYVPDGQDAAVSYGSLDFKFRNDSSRDIVIKISSDSSSINARILQ